ncbi:MAG: ArnT family glycosyltransferase [Pirellulales bacterium]
MKSAALRVLVGLMLGAHGALLAWSAWAHSPTWDETSHLVAGIGCWQHGRFDLYCVNPPLVRVLATAPVVLARPKTDWRQYDVGVGVRPETTMRDDFFAANGARTIYLMTLARWACIPLSIFGALVCYRWAAELYGSAAGFLALALWCFEPNILTHAQLITPDAGGAAMGVVAGYAFWRWLRSESLGSAVAAGIGLGLAELTKATWIILFAVWPLLWLAWKWCDRRRAPNGRFLIGAAQLGLILFLGIWILNLGYGFEGSFRRLDEFEFVSRSLGGSGVQPVVRVPHQNRFAGTWLGRLPMPVPQNYVRGIDLQKRDFEIRDGSYLRGQWRNDGWWYYYLYAMAIKVPLGTWALVLLAGFVSLRGDAGKKASREGDAPAEPGKGGQAAHGTQGGPAEVGTPTSWRDEMILLAPAAVVLVLISSQTGLCHHMRYALPIFPFVFIWTSKVARAVQFNQWVIASAAGAALLWSVASSLYYYPHSMSYFNELVGGPLGGHWHLHNSNTDWGQDLLYLKRWLDEHPEARPLALAFFAPYAAGIAGVEYTGKPPAGPGPSRGPIESLGPKPGWFALSTNCLHERSGQYEYFFRFEPVAMAGYSIYIYHITLEEANRVRKELGLPELDKERSS